MQFAEWMSYYEIEPFGEERGDLRSGIVASVLANVHRDRKKQRKAYTPRDFMPKFDREQEQQTWEQQLALVEVLNEAFGGKDLRKGKDDHDSNAGN